MFRFFRLIFNLNAKQNKCKQFNLFIRKAYKLNNSQV